MTVLILAQELDPTADAVVGELVQRQVPVFRTDLSDFPSRLRLDAQLRDGRWSGRLWTDHRDVELDGVRSIWNRNPSTYVFSASMTAAEQDFAYREAKLGLGRMLASLGYRDHSAAFHPESFRSAADRHRE